MQDKFMNGKMFNFFFKLLIFVRPAQSQIPVSF